MSRWAELSSRERNRDDAFEVMQDYLTRFKHIDAVWAADDDMAVGVLKAIDQAKRSDIKLVFGGASAKGMIKTLMDGADARIQANVSYSPKFIYDAIKMTAEARLKGEKLPAKTIIPSVLITNATAKDYYFPHSPSNSGAELSRSHAAPGDGRASRRLH